VNGSGVQGLKRGGGRGGDEERVVREREGKRKGRGEEEKKRKNEVGEGCEGVSVRWGGRRGGGKG